MKKPKLINTLFFLALFLFFLIPPSDPDLGWQLRCGQLIWQKHLLCSKNQFSVLLENYPWPNHHWLYQLFIFPVFKLFSLWGLSFLNAFLMSLAFLFFYLAIKNYSWEKMLAIGLILFASWGVFSFGIRSQLIGLFFFNLLLLLFSKVRQSPKLAIILPLIMLVWTNSHGSVIIGLVLLFFLGLKETVRQPKKLPFFTFVFFSSSLITLLNPFGFRIYQEAWRHFAVVGLDKLIAEWLPPNKPVWWLVFLSSLGLFFYLLGNNKTQDKFAALGLLPFTLIALKARRHVPFYFFLSFSLFFASSLTKTTLAFWLKKKILKNNLAGISATMFLLFALFIRLPQTLNTNFSWENYCQKSSLNYPCGAVELLKTQPEKGNIFNRYEWGGFLIWQLPEYKVFVDGRMPAWPTPSGKSPYTIYLETLQTQPGWQETLKKYNIDWILISPGTFMDLKLRPNPEKFGWQEAYRDRGAVVYKRKAHLN